MPGSDNIDGLIVSISKIKETSGKTTPDNWIIACAEFFHIAVSHLYGIEAMIYIDPEIAKQLPHRDKDNFTTYLSARYSNGDYKLPGISTFFNAFSGQIVLADWAALPRPIDAYAVPYRQMKIDSGIGNAKQVLFLCYSVNQFALPGISGAPVPLWLFFGTKQGLLDLLKIKAIPPPAPGTEPKPEPEPKPDPKPDTKPEPTPEPVTGWKAALEAGIVAAIDSFSTAWLQKRHGGE
jgi:hypothetical protein